MGRRRTGAFVWSVERGESDEVKWRAPGIGRGSGGVRASVCLLGRLRDGGSGGSLGESVGLL